MVTVCAMVATLMQALDNTIANVALPDMQGSLRPPPTRLDLPSGGAQVRLDRGSPFLASGLRLCSSCSTGGSSRIGHSTEIIAELVVACLGIYLFIVHLFTSNNPLIPPRIFRDVNFATGFLIMFAIVMILLSSMALHPPYLQNLGSRAC
jgi:hypothetical protein